jgi:hypothetical protein
MLPMLKKFPLWTLTLLIAIAGCATGTEISTRGSAVKPVEGEEKQGKEKPKPRAMLLLSNLGRDNDLTRRGWYAVWCYAPLVRKRTVHHWRETVPVATWARHRA